MSFFGSLSEAKSTMHGIEISTNVGHSKGREASKIRDGYDEPGVTEAHQALPALEQKRTNLHRRVDFLTRKYGSTGTGGEAPHRSGKGAKSSGKAVPKGLRYH